MDRLHARYPFLSSARAAVMAEPVDLATVVSEDRAVVERALERVERAIAAGDVGGPHADDRVELLSYPIARVLVSLVDEHVLTRRYARAEAATAHERLEVDLAATNELRSVDDPGIGLEALLEEFGLDDAIERAEGGILVDVGAYLQLASDLWGDEWRLVNRALTDGVVPVTDEELRLLLREAIRRRVETDLPLEVPGAVSADLETAVASIRETLAELELTREIDTVVPELFPPCMKALLDDIQRGEHLPHHSRFAITAFLTSIGMTTDDIVELYQVNSSFGEEMTRYQTDHIRGETSPTEYSPPSCATMQSYGDCVNMDDLCERIPHPMAYYEERLDEADEDDLEDWRETVTTDA